MAATIPNGSIPTVTGGVPQSSNIYPQQQQQRQFNNNGGAGNMRNAQEEQCKIFVGGVGKNTNDESLRAYFSKFGQIADSVIMQDRETGEPRGFAFVTFTTPEAVAAVIEQRNNGGHTLDGKMIDPKPAVRQGPGQRASFGGNNQMMNNMSNMSKPMPQNPMYKGPMNVAEELKIFVGGIGIGTTEEDVKNYFNTFGEVVAVNMPYHQIYKCPKGFAFVGFKSTEVVASVVKDRYHQINGKTVEVKGADEQQQHLRKKQESRYSNPQHSRTPFGTIGTIGGGVAGAGFANLAAAGQQVLIPQVINGQTQYVAAQIPAAPQPAPQQYVFDPATNTYYQLPATTSLLGAGGAAGAYNPYAGIQMMASAAAGTTAGSPLAAAGMAMSAAALAGGGGGGGADASAAGQLGALYSNETSTFGPSRSHVLDAGHQQPIAGGAGGATDPQVVYSNAAAHSGGESVPSRGYHPYGR